ncbi:peroxiredoxin [Tepidamorphus sp. 3E244]|uniref:peroxiredoxin n=1 Tax=Tepidamorphus sp. 3E244 TaxID=3385498 RepID=UPI0038FC3ADE
MIAVGDRLPQAQFFVKTENGREKRSTDDVFGGRKVVLFGVPGAFTGTCSKAHLPGFVNNAETFHAHGIDEIACVSVNDADVLHAWSHIGEADGKVTMLSDGNAEFTKALGLDIDMSGAGMGTRSKRYSMVVDDGVVKKLNIEESPGKAEASSAETLLAQL